MNNKKNKKQFKIEKKQFKIVKKTLKERVDSWEDHTNKKIKQRTPSKSIEVFSNKEVQKTSTQTVDLTFFANKPSEIIKKKKHYIITNLKLYDLDGEPIRIYSEVRLDAQRYKEGWGNSDTKTQDKWIEYYDKKKNKNLPSLPLLYAIINAAKDSQDKNSVARDLLKSLKEEFYLVTSSRFDFYSQTKIYHDFGTKEQIELIQDIPELRWSREKLSKLVEDPKWEKPLRALFMTEDVKEIPEILGIYGSAEFQMLGISARTEQNPIFLSTFGSSPLNIESHRDLFYEGYSRGIKVKISYDKTGVQNE